MYVSFIKFAGYASVLGKFFLLDKVLKEKFEYIKFVNVV